MCIIDGFFIIFTVCVRACVCVRVCVCVRLTGSSCRATSPTQDMRRKYSENLTLTIPSRSFSGVNHLRQTQTHTDTHTYTDTDTHKHTYNTDTDTGKSKIFVGLVSLH